MGKKVIEPLNHLASIILDGFASQHDSPAYLEEKRERLVGLDKWQSLHHLGNCGEGVQQYVAQKIGVSTAELRTAIQVIDRC